MIVPKMADHFVAIDAPNPDHAGVVDPSDMDPLVCHDAVGLVDDGFDYMVCDQHEDKKEFHPAVPPSVLVDERVAGPKSRKEGEFQVSRAHQNLKCP
jgi:hypothetical protein